MAKTELELYQEEQRMVDLRVDSIMNSHKALFECMNEPSRSIIRNLLKEAYFSGKAIGIFQAYQDMQENSK